MEKICQMHQITVAVKNMSFLDDKVPDYKNEDIHRHEDILINGQKIFWQTFQKIKKKKQSKLHSHPFPPYQTCNLSEWLNFKSKFFICSHTAKIP